MEVGSLATCFVANEVTCVSVSVCMEKPALAICLVSLPFSDEDCPVGPLLDPESLLLLVLVSLALVDSLVLFEGLKLVFSWDLDWERTKVTLCLFDLLQDGVINGSRLFV